MKTVRRVVARRSKPVYQHQPVRVEAKMADRVRALLEGVEQFAAGRQEVMMEEMVRDLSQARTGGVDGRATDGQRRTIETRLMELDFRRDRSVRRYPDGFRQLGEWWVRPEGSVRSASPVEVVERGREQQEAAARKVKESAVARKVRWEKEIAVAVRGYIQARDSVMYEQMLLALQGVGGIAGQPRHWQRRAMQVGLLAAGFRRDSRKWEYVEGVRVPLGRVGEWWVRAVEAQSVSAAAVIGA